MTDSLLRSLQEKYSSGSLRPNELDNSGVSLTHQAARDGQLTCLKWLLKHGGDLNTRSADGSVPAHYAAAGGHLQVLYYLHEKRKESVSVKNSEAVTPLFVAAQEGQLDCLIWLIKTSSTPPNVQKNNGTTPSHAAAQEGKLECLRYLLKAAHATSTLTDNYGCTLLHYAGVEGHWKIAKWLVEHCGLGGEEQDYAGATALHVSARAGREKVIEALLKCGVSPDIKDNRGLTALHYSIESKQTSCTKLLQDMTSPISSSTLYDSQNQKKVRFNEQVYTYDTSSIRSRNSTIDKRTKKERRAHFYDDDFKAQFEYWSNSPKIKRKREVKNAQGLCKPRSEYLSNTTKQKLAEVSVSDSEFSFDQPQLLETLDQSTTLEQLKENVRPMSECNRAPKVPSRNGVPKLPKQYQTGIQEHQNENTILKTRGSSKNILTPAGNFVFDEKSLTPTSDQRHFDSVQYSSIKPQNTNFISPRDQTDFKNRSSPKLSPIIPPKLKESRQPPDGQSSVNSIISPNLSRKTPFSHTSPPDVPVRQNDVNRRVVGRNSKLNMINGTQNSPKAQIQRHSQMTTSSPVLQRKSNNTTIIDDDRPSYNATQYIPKSYLNKKSTHSQDFRYNQNRPRENISWSGQTHSIQPSFSSNLRDLDMGGTAQQDKVGFYSNNILTDKKNKPINKSSTWSNIRNGVSNLLNMMMLRKTDQPSSSTWSNGRPNSRSRYYSREDIFSRFSIPKKASRRDFDDLFNSSTEGRYIAYNTNAMHITTPQTRTRSASSQSNYNEPEFTRFKTRTLDSSLKGNSRFVNDVSLDSYTNRPASKIRRQNVNKIMW